LMLMLMLVVQYSSLYLFRDNTVRRTQVYQGQSSKEK
jgi:hypothetical protein